MNDREPTAPPAPMRDAARTLLQRFVDRGRLQFDRAASAGRTRLELRQLQRDRDHFWVRLGKEAYHLVEAGEVDHPALRRAMERIDELELRINEQQLRVEESGADR